MINKTKRVIMDIKKEIRKLLIEKGVNMTDLVNLLNEKSGKQDSLQNLSGKLNRNSLKFKEVEEILDVIGYEFQIISKKEA